MKHLVKAAHLRAYDEGRYGNKLQTWPNYEALFESGYAGTVSVRSTLPSSTKKFYEVPVKRVDLIRECIYQIQNEGGLPLFNESAPDKFLTLQGEVCLNEQGLCLFYDTTPGLKMQTAMRQAKQVYRLHAKYILEKYLNQASLEDLLELLNNVCALGGVIEFSTYSVCCGTIRGRNTVIWEVRHY